jgi:hypothetical protein
MRSFRLPPPKRANPAWVALSVAAHAMAALVLASVAGRTYVRERTDMVMLMPPTASDEGGPREVQIPTYAGVPSGRTGGGGGQRAAGIVVSPRIASTLPPRDPRFVIGDPGGVGDSLTMPGPIGERRILGPAYGDGRLWVKVDEAELGVVGPSPDVGTHVTRVEQAMRERIKAFIDTMPRDSFALPPPPDWTTEVDGNTWGIDRSWIYLGDIKIPTALLALIPLPQGNIERAREAAELQRIRQDIIQAARRAQTAEEFRRLVDQLRRRKDAERAAERARRDTIFP